MLFVSRELGKIIASVGLALSLSNCAVEGEPVTASKPPVASTSIPRHQFEEVWMSDELVRFEWNGYRDNRAPEDVLTKIGARHHIVGIDDAEGQPYLYVSVNRNLAVIAPKLRSTIYRPDYSVAQIAGNLYRIGWGRGEGTPDRLDRVLTDFGQDCKGITLAKPRDNNGRYLISGIPNCFRP